MVLEFLVWWGEQLVSLVPGSVRGQFSGASKRLVLEYKGSNGRDLGVTTAGVVDVRLEEGTSVGGLGRFPLDRRGLEGLRAVLDRAGPLVETVLQLPPGMILEKTLSLPLAAQRDLGHVVEYELDHETPFSADEVYWAVSVLGRDRLHGQLTAHLGLVLKRDADPILRSLQDSGITLAAIIGANDGLRIRLKSTTGAGPLFAASRRAAAVPRLVLAAMALVILAIAGPFVRQSIGFAITDSRIAALQSNADTAQALRHQIGDASAGDKGDPQAAIGNPLVALAAVTDALPDDTYLTDFTEHHRELVLTGESAAAAALIERLSDNAVLRDPAFAAPVTRDETSGADSFSIRVGLRQP